MSCDLCGRPLYSEEMELKVCLTCLRNDACRCRLCKQWAEAHRPSPLPVTSLPERAPHLGPLPP